VGVPVPVEGTAVAPAAIQGVRPAIAPLPGAAPPPAVSV